MGLLDFLRKPKSSDDFPRPEVPFHAHDLLMDRYFGLSEKIRMNGPLDVRLHYCEQMLSILPDVLNQWRVEYSDEPIPPLIPCRDYAPDWYGRLGKWDEAVRVINFCVNCEAYTATEGRDALEWLLARKTAAEAALAYIAANPGCKQSAIYKALPDVDRDALKWFTRNSAQIRKTASGSTNALYVL